MICNEKFLGDFRCVCYIIPDKWREDAVSRAAAKFHAADPDHTKVQTTDGLGNERRTGHSKLVYDKTTHTIGVEPNDVACKKCGRLYRECGCVPPKPDSLHKPDERALTHPDSQQIRIEALRAASRVVAGVQAAGNDLTDKDGKPAKAHTSTLFMVEQFARWIERGER